MFEMISIVIAYSINYLSLKGTERGRCGYNLRLNLLREAMFCETTL